MMVSGRSVIICAASVSAPRCSASEAAFAGVDMSDEPANPPAAMAPPAFNISRLLGTCRSLEPADQVLVSHQALQPNVQARGLGDQLTRTAGFSMRKPRGYLLTGTFADQTTASGRSTGVEVDGDGRAGIRGLSDSLGPTTWSSTIDDPVTPAWYSCV